LIGSYNTIFTAYKSWERFISLGKLCRVSDYNKIGLATRELPKN
jgi:hypothetical protein